MKSLAFLIPIFLFLCCKSSTTEVNNLSRDRQIIVDSEIEIDSGLYQLIFNVITDNNLNNECKLLVYIDNVTFNKTIISIFETSNVPVLSEHGIPFLKIKIIDVWVYMFTGIENYIISLNSDKFIDVAHHVENTNCKYGDYQFIDSLSTYKEISGLKKIPFN